MKLLDSFAIAWKSLVANKLRSSLTMLGIVIGVGAVIALMSVGRGAQAKITSTFSEMGTNVLYVMPRSQDVGGLAGMGTATPTLTLDDAKAISERVPDVIAVAPANENYSQVTHAGNSTTSVIYGVTPEFQIVMNYAVTSGRYLNNQDVQRRDQVAVIGSKVRDDLFETGEPLGQKLKIKGKDFLVIGVLETKGGVFMGVSADNVIAVPITTFQTRLFIQKTAQGQDAVGTIEVQVASADQMGQVTDEIKALLHDRHRIAPDEKNDFTVVSQDQILGVLSSVIGIFTIFLGSIAGISLLVGSIGIMNIMLVSVTERTREIGIRKAIGAKRRDIMLQFLVEAATLSLIGGGVGLASGWSLAYLVSLININGQNIQTVVSPDIVILVLSISIFIGLFSGMYPAVRASRLNPIEALRYG